MKAKVYAVPSFLLFLIISFILLCVGCFSIFGEYSVFILNGVLFLSVLSVTGLGYSVYENMRPAISNRHIRQAVATVSPALALAGLLFLFVFAEKAYEAPGLFVDTRAAAQQIIFMVFNISIGLQAVFFLGSVGFLVYKKAGLREILAILLLLLIILLLTVFWDMFIYFQNIHFISSY